VDTKTTGLDVVLSYETSVGDDGKIKVGLIGNINDLEIKKIHNREGEVDELNEYKFFGPFSQAYLEAAAPDYKFGLNLGYSNEKFDATVSLTQFSEVSLFDFQWVEYGPANEAEALNYDTSGDGNGDTNFFEAGKDIYKAMMTVDLSLGYKISEKLKLSIGANNLFNKYPTPQFDGWTDQGGLADSVQMGSDGMYLFGRLSFSL